MGVGCLSYQSNSLNFKTEEACQRRLDPLPSTKLILPHHQPQYSRKITHHFCRQVIPCAIPTHPSYNTPPPRGSHALRDSPLSSLSFSLNR
jgi:hypothetical protein